MKSFTRVLIISALTLALYGNVAVAGQRITIDPTGNQAADVANVQAALDALSASRRGGVITLNDHNTYGVPTAFNFGEDPDPTQRGFVIINPGQSGRIVIRGARGDNDEDDDDDGPRAQTIIAGGFLPIRMQGGGRLVVKDVVFQGPFQSAIYVQSSSGVTIRNNVFLDTQGFTEIFASPLTRVIYFEGLGFDENQITGKIVVRGNVIDNAIGWFTDGIAFFFTNAKTTVANNQITGVNLGIRQDEYAQAFRATGNHLSASVPAPGFFGGGIIASCGLGDSPAVALRNNYIDVTDDTLAGAAIGISVNADDFARPVCVRSNTTIQGNHIHLTNGFDALDLGTFGIFDGSAAFNDNLIANNVISGNALGGIALAGFLNEGATTTFEISGNKVLNNDLSGLDSVFFDIILDQFTSGNFVIAREGDNVVDEGAGNRVFFRRPYDDDDD